MTPRVLIVDDDPLIRELLQAYLSQEGYDVHCAATAELAETFLASQAVDLVMLDIRLPGKDGLTLTRELRVRSEVGIILITGRNDEIDRIVGLECGADDYVIKPLNPRELVSRAKKPDSPGPPCADTAAGCSGRQTGQAVRRLGAGH